MLHAELVTSTMVQDLQAFRVGWVGMERKEVKPSSQASNQLRNSPEESIVRFIKNSSGKKKSVNPKLK